VTGQVAAERFGTKLPHGVDAPRLARGLLGAWAGATLGPDQLDTARLLVSELVTNAVVHGRGKITLRVWLRADAVRVEVRDQGEGFAHSPRRPEAPIPGGWGLQLVSMQSSRWGIGHDCARVWFELDLDGALATPDGSPSTVSASQSPPAGMSDDRPLPQGTLR
jgi:anti-sigma regulatory factor (Ser/Thr protein kinase)